MLRGRNSVAAAPKAASLDSQVAELKGQQDELAQRLAVAESSHKELAAQLFKEVRRLNGELEEALAKADASSSEVGSSLVELRKELQEVRKAAEVGQEAARRAEAAGQEAAAVRAELGTSLAEAAARERAALEELRRSLAESEQRVAEAARRGSEEAERRCQGALAAQAAAGEAARAAEAAALGARCEALQGALDGLASEIRGAKAEHTDKQEAHASDFASRLESLQAELRAELRASLQQTDEALAKQFAAVELAAKAQLQVLHNTAHIAENVFSRSVVWQARGFKKRLSALIHEEEQFIRSPPFSVSCLPEMRLEIQMASKDDAPEASLVGPSLPLPGSCSVGLWGPPGLRAVFRVTMGDGQTAVSRRFEHTFLAGERANEASRTLFVAQNFCRLNQVWVRETDQVQVAFELLEFQSGPLSPVPALAALLEAPGSPASPPAARGKSPAGVAEDSLAFSHGATAQELVHERLSGELQAVKNRSVRRVEWRLEGCARLLECRVGEAIDSPIFCAAGLERIQFHFYPRDVSATGSAVQPCALYVSGPARTTIKAMLWVGSASRSLEHRYQKRGDTAGRSRFCALEGQVDCNDSVLLALDIIEVETDMPDQASASLCLRDARPAGPNQAPPAASGGHGSPLNGTKGTLRMKREDPSKTEEFAKCVSLPTLNARQLKLPVAMKGRPGT